MEGNQGESNVSNISVYICLILFFSYVVRLFVLPVFVVYPPKMIPNSRNYAYRGDFYCFNVDVRRTSFLH